MKKKQKIIIIISITLVLLAVTLTSYLVLKPKKEKKIKTIKVLDSIEGYDYKLEDRDGILYQDIFMLLKSCLEKDEVDFSEYAQLISQLFIIDLYTIDNKINKYDVGSVDFIHPEVIDNYSLNVRDTLYRYLEDNTNDKRTQTLPEVTDIDITNTEEIEYDYNDKTYPAFEIDLEWSYKKDLGYDEDGTVIVVKQNEMLYIIEKTDVK